MVGLASSQEEETSVFMRVKRASHGMKFELVPTRFLFLKLAMNICHCTTVGKDLVLKKKRMSVSLPGYILGEFGLSQIEECYTTRTERQRINSEDSKPMTTLLF
jgi:hypothetical protein